MYTNADNLYAKPFTAVRRVMKTEHFLLTHFVSQNFINYL